MKQVSFSFLSGTWIECSAARLLRFQYILLLSVYGLLAQLVERLLCKQGAAGSSPAFSTGRVGGIVHWHGAPGAPAPPRGRRRQAEDARSGVGGGRGDARRGARRRDAGRGPRAAGGGAREGGAARRERAGSEGRAHGGCPGSRRR